jgi:hypothetical protein
MKTLREHHLETRLNALKDDLVDYSKLIISIEMLALTKSWDYLCDKTTILILSKNIYEA